ncbi:MAG TPA: hypothetical protein VGO11_02335 [Chthoniobacteraceae bacterium]|nr:hypothetical protein [Chthoniobacteraceae bacterium]
MKRFPLQAWRCAAFLLTISTTALPAEPTPPAKPPAETILLEEIPKRVAKLEEDLTHALEAAQAAVEEEAKAERISRTVAQSLRWTFRPGTVASGVDLRGVISTAPVPPDNERLTTAAKEVETAGQRLQTGRAELGNDVKKEIRNRVSEAIRTASKPEEVAGLIETLKPFDGGLKGTPSNAFSDLPSFVSNANMVLRTLHRVLVTQAAGETGTTANELSNLRSQLQTSREIGNVGDVDLRQQAILAPAQKEADQTRETLDAAVQQRKPAAELNRLLAAHLTALDHWNDLRPPTQRGFGGGSPHERAAKGYAYLFDLLARLEKGLPITQSEIDNGRPSLDGLDTKSSLVYNELIKTWQQESAIAAEKRAQERDESIRRRLAAAQKPADLDQIATDLSAWEREGSHQFPEETTGQYGRYLKALSVCWANPTPALYQQVHQLEAQTPAGPFSPEATQLKEHVERDVLSQMLKAPELKADPLREQPIAAAVEKMCDDLAAKGEWRRLYELLRLREPGGREESRGREDDPVSALHAFFAAQNMELAEQWAEAAQLYREVLQNVSARAPVKPAAERLKAMKKEHPDAFKLTH